MDVIDLEMRADGEGINSEYFRAAFNFRETRFRGRFQLLQGRSRIVTVTYVPVPACEWIRPRLACFTCRRSLPKCLGILCCNCQNVVTACINPVAPTG